MHIAYLVNQYPKVSHSFVRREILALERLGVKVHRFALRGWDAELVDPEDRRERTATRFVLQGGWRAVLSAVCASALLTPGRFLSAFGLATRMGRRRSDRSLVYHWIYLAEACVLARWIKQVEASHLHAHFGTNSAEVAMFVQALQGTPYSFTVHGPEEFDRPESIGLTEKCRRASFIVAISSFCRSQLFRWADSGDWQKIHVVHCGLDAAFLQSLSSAPPDVMRLVCVGRLCEQKGQLLLLQAMRQLMDQGLMFDLVLAGDGEMRSAIIALIDQLGLQQRVRITGWISSKDVRHEIQAARAMILPSFAEGLPVVLMEAMALGRPVLSTYVAGIPELVHDGLHGWLFPAGDVNAMAAAIRDCLQAAPERLMAMGEQARQHVTRRHDIDHEAAHLVELFGRSGAH
jgi:glycosyltransferase involved in cell wall biosynthesis